MKTLILGACLLIGCSSSALDASDANAGGASGSAGGGAQFVNTCSAARAQLLGAQETVSTGVVKVLSTAGAVTRLYLNATAGGASAAPTSPWLYLSLGDAAKVEVSDVSAVSSTGWDLAFKRAIVYTNAGDGGPGQAGAVLLEKDFADITRADASNATFVDEMFFDDECNPSVDVTGQVYTSFADWYSYDADTHVLTPGSGTWLVRSATGSFFKLKFDSYYATPSGGMGSTAGAYILSFEAL